MKYALLFAALATVYWSAESKITPPKVQVYSKGPGQFGKENTLMCRVTGFHPPNIEIRLMRNGEEIPGAVQSDLAFESDWHFHLIRHVSFTPQSGDEYACKVTHDKSPPRSYVWEPNM